MCSQLYIRHWKKLLLKVCQGGAGVAHLTFIDELAKTLQKLSKILLNIIPMNMASLANFGTSFFLYYSLDRKSSKMPCDIFSDVDQIFYTLC